MKQNYTTTTIHSIYCDGHILEGSEINYFLLKALIISTIRSEQKKKDFNYT